MKKLILLFVIAIPFLLLAQDCTITALYTNTDINIDGKLDEYIWASTELEIEDIKPGYFTTKVGDADMKMISLQNLRQYGMTVVYTVVFGLKMISTVLPTLRIVLLLHKVGWMMG